MTDLDYTRKLDELDQLLNDPDVPMQPARVWTLLAELSEHDLAPEHPNAV
ncbi:MAG: peptide chain release factor 1 [Acetobacteraceae bacterium]|nr:peptide chain release factor 1 [Acetobacteraceae bacterium]